MVVFAILLLPLQKYTNMLFSIRSELASDFGFSLSTVAEKSYLNKLINDAASEIYRDNELYMSDREQIFDVGSENQIITLPSDVDKVLAARRYETRTQIKQQDMRPRYRSLGWAAPYLGYPYLQWRFKNRSCLKKEFLNVSPFTYTINQVVAGGFSIVITGKTETASRITETISFTGADITKVGSVPFVEYFSMQKNKTMSQDVIVTDSDGHEVAVLPNNELQVSYPYYQILDRYETFGPSNTLVEILYKLTLPVLVLDTDSFLDNIYDKVVYWKAASSYYAKKSGEDSLTRASAYDIKANSVLAAINESYMRNATSEITYAPTAGISVMSAVRAGAYTNF